MSTVQNTNISKAKKGTPEYEEWLRHYREKRAGKQSQEDNSLSEIDKVRVGNAVRDIMQGKISKVAHILESIKDESKIQRRFDAIAEQIPAERLSQLKKQVGSAVPSVRKERKEAKEVSEQAKSQIRETAKSAIDNAVKAATKHFKPIKDAAKFTSRFNILRENLGYNNPIVNAVAKIAEENGVQIGSDRHYYWEKPMAKDRDRMNSIILNPLKQELSSISIPEDIVSQANLSNYSDDFERFIVKNSSSSVEKAKKGTAEYEEWLRKYREKRGKKQEDEANNKRTKASDILAEAKTKAEQLDLFPQFTKEEEEIASVAPQLLVPQEDVRVRTQVTKSYADVVTDGELLAATQQPVFANMFGHYPIHSLSIQDRKVTTPVEEIDVALAEEPDTVTDEMLSDSNLIATEKVDGCRCTIICTPEATRLTARRQQYSEKPPTDYTNNLPHIRDLDLYSVLGDTVIDSETVASNPIEVAPGKFGDSLASTMSVLGQEKDLSICVEKMEKYGPLVNFCFDIQRYKGQDLRKLPYKERMQYLDKALEEVKQAFGTEYIKRVAIQREDETKKEFFDRITANNGEGCVLAKADGPYIAFDRKNRIKYKRRVELTLQVMEILEGKGRNAGQAGSFIMGAVINGVLTPIANLNVGDDKLRREVWANKSDYIGKQIETTSMQMTLGSGKDGQPRLRHPRWKTPGMFREDKSTPDDISKTIEVLKKRRNGE